MIILSTLSSSCLRASSLPETLEPPTTATNGLIGFSSTLPKKVTSLASKNPAAYVQHQKELLLRGLKRVFYDKHQKHH